MPTDFAAGDQFKMIGSMPETGDSLPTRIPNTDTERDTETLPVSDVHTS